MDSIWLWPLALVAFLMAWPALHAVALRVLGGRVRSQADTAQPDHIYLVRVAEPNSRHEQSRQTTERQLAEAGFVEAGAYLVREMPELSLALYAHPAERAYAVIYDHPRSGSWAEFVTRYEDGSLATYTTLEPVELDLPEGSVHVAAPQLSLGVLWKRMLNERAEKSMRPCDRSHAARDFERGYAESMAYHKRRSPQVVNDDHDEDMKQAA